MWRIILLRAVRGTQVVMVVEGATSRARRFKLLLWKSRVEEYRIGRERLGTGFWILRPYQMVFKVGLFYIGVGRFIDEWYGTPELLFDGPVTGEAMPVSICYCLYFSNSAFDFAWYSDESLQQ